MHVSGLRLRVGCGNRLQSPLVVEAVDRLPVVARHEVPVVVDRQAERRFPRITGGPEIDEISDDEIPTGSERILFIDDEEALVEMGMELLTELGYEVICRGGSKEALALLKKDVSRFDLVITDQTMPEMTGLELAKKILSIRPGMPIILCTGFSHQVDAETAKQAGIKAFVMKPLVKREIAKAIRDVLDE